MVLVVVSAALYILVISLPDISGLRNRAGEERRRQTLYDKRDNNFV